VLDWADCILMVPISKDQALAHFHSSIATFKDGTIIYKYNFIDELQKIDSELPQDAIEKLRPIDGKFVVWGAKPQGLRGVLKECIEGMDHGKVASLLFYIPRKLCLIGRVVAKTKSEKIAERLWGRDIDGSTWSLVYFIEPQQVVEADIDEVRKLVNHPIPGHTCICRDDKDPRRFAELVRYISTRRVYQAPQRFITDHLVLLRQLSKYIKDERRFDIFLTIIGLITLKTISKTNGLLKSDCLDVAVEFIRGFLGDIGDVSDIRRIYGRASCNDLRRLCVITLGSDSDWESEVSARIAGIGEISRGVYESIWGELDLNDEDLAKLLSSLIVLLSEYRSELGIECPADSLGRKVSEIDEEHRQLVDRAREIFKDIVRRYPDVIAVIPARVWATVLR